MSNITGNILASFRNAAQGAVKFVTKACKAVETSTGVMTIGHAVAAIPALAQFTSPILAGFAIASLLCGGARLVVPDLSAKPVAVASAPAAPQQKAISSPIVTQALAIA